MAGSVGASSGGGVWACGGGGGGRRSGVTMERRACLLFLGVVACGFVCVFCGGCGGRVGVRANQTAEWLKKNTITNQTYPTDRLAGGALHRPFRARAPTPAAAANATGRAGLPLLAATAATALVCAHCRSTGGLLSLLLQRLLLLRRKGNVGRLCMRVYIHVCEHLPPPIQNTPFPKSIN